MHLQHYSLSEPPFTLTPDTEFFFNDSSHQQALNVLLVALQSGKGFIKVGGEVGTGKTLFCRQLHNLFDDNYVTAYIANPLLNPMPLRMALEQGGQWKQALEGFKRAADLPLNKPVDEYVSPRIHALSDKDFHD